MEKFEVNILGCGAAIPIGRHMTTSQLVNVHDKLFMVDCGEGTQTQIWKSGIKLDEYGQYIYQSCSWRPLLWSCAFAFFTELDAG